MLTIRVFIFLLFFSPTVVFCQFERIYHCVKIQGSPVIDGKEDSLWTKANWSSSFIDIAGKPQTMVPYPTRFKLLWNTDTLFVFAEIYDTDIWATKSKRDATVFQDNAFEIFIDPEGDGLDYYEIQINAKGTIWDLQMSKPYANGGKANSKLDIEGLRHAIEIDGTLNEPYPKDRRWTIELALPFKSLSVTDTLHSNWRMNFARVQWKLHTRADKYVKALDSVTKKKLLPSYFLWRAHGELNMHLPDRFGKVIFLQE